MMSDGERVRRVKAALAEAGYPDCGFDVDPEDDDGYVCDTDVPLEAVWRSVLISSHDARDEMACWPCFSQANASDPPTLPDPPCTHDPLTSEWPPVPERVA